MRGPRCFRENLTFPPPSPYIYSPLAKGRRLSGEKTGGIGLVVFRQEGRTLWRLPEFANAWFALGEKPAA